MRRNTTITSLAAALVMLGSRLNAADFIRGDANGDGKVSISDSKFLLNFLFRPGSEAGCLSALDTNGDRLIDISDAVTLLNAAYLGGPALLPPYPSPGPEPN